jgi:hypothetical protein
MVSPESGEVETEVVDLGSVPLAELLELTELDTATATLIAQVRQPRVNLGTGPPGRAD